MKKLFTSLLMVTVLLCSCSSKTVLNEDVPKYREPVNVLKEELPKDFSPKDFHIVSIGDSLTFGVGDSTNSGGYLPYLEARLENEKGVRDARLLNLGVRGHRTSQLLNKLQAEDVQKAITAADIVILTTGGNDIMKVVKENFSDLRLNDFVHERVLYEEQLAGIIGAIKKANPAAVVYLVGLYNPFFQYFADIRELDLIMEDWNETSKKVLAKYPEAYFVDVAEVFRNSDRNLLHSDYFHPNDDGYKLMAEQIYLQIQERLFKKTSSQKITTKRSN
ncbi:SGNH/GDSL hydrolase family protein [Bacillus dakarensis]|uniref:SGNH/GDSL hydrolase family protein n=1 Tax=Robertmurraya dakarensis TaxID=1926278 RepID=UPI000981745B|nr:SGNH/GDSL hydrolase family protein [Bacillus dakarensis]